MKKFAVSLNARASADDGVLFDFLSHPYVAYLRLLDIMPILVPNNLADVSAYLDAVQPEGLLLTGGGDVDPARYGQANTHADHIIAARDTTEFALLDWATAHNLPVIGICRGIQVINVYFGGSLVQDIPAQLGDTVSHDGATHMNCIVNERIADLLGTRAIGTNSHHHQGVTDDRLAADLIPFAISEADGLIEGVLHRDRPVIGVQWHPERPTPSRESDLVLFRHFLAHGMLAPTAPIPPCQSR